MTVSIIILNYNKPHLTLACLASLYEQYTDELKKGAFEIIIVDNASVDDSVQVLKSAIHKEKYTYIHFIENKHNDGFSKGCNIGVKKAQGTYLLFLNNDTVVKDKGLVDMIGFMDQHSDAGIVGGELSNPDGSHQPSVGSFYSPIGIALLLLGLQKYGIVDKNPSAIHEVDWVKGALLMIRRNMFEKLGGFDEQIFMYTEDMELCYRTKLLGQKVYFYPDITVIHEEAGSSNRTFAIVQIYQNLLYFYKKHRSYAEYFFVKSLLRAKAVTLVAVGRLLHNSYYIQTYEKALKATR